MKSILVGHVCSPGIWKRAPLITPDGRKATALRDPMAAVFLGERGSIRGLVELEADEGLRWALKDIEPAWSVCLDDRLGLGLAGLAGTVAKRGAEGGRISEWARVENRIEHVVMWAGAQPWGTRWNKSHDDVPDWYAWLVEALCEISTYLRLTDDLCDAVGWKRECHEVAEWVHVGLNVVGHDTWMLRVPSTGRAKSFVFEPGYVDGWLPAIEKVLETL